MSVKRRLYLSNILMLILPILLVIVTAICMLLIYQGVTGFRGGPPMSNGEQLQNRMNQAEKLSAKLAETADMQQLEQILGEFNRERQESGVQASLYLQGQRLYPLDASITLPADVGAPQSASSVVLTDRYAIYRFPAGEYTLALTDTSFNIGTNRSQRSVYVGIFMLALITGIVIFTNRFLTRFVVRSIAGPIDTLVEGVHQLRDGNLTYRILHEKQDEFAAVCRDFNEMAEQLSEMVEERKKNESSRRELIAGISHDLRTPLTSIKAYLEGLEKGIAVTPQMQAKYFATIKGKVEHLEHIINQLFLFSKLDVGEFPLYLERVDLGGEMERLVRVFAAEYYPKGLDLIIEGNLPHVAAKIDPVQFRNVIQNVLENSLKYTDKERAQVVVSGNEGEQTVEIRLNDNGPGVEAEELDRLFDVFYRSDDSRKRTELGSGLGLAISSKVIERLGGRISAHSASAGGLSIRIVLPKAGGVEADHEKNTDY